MKTINFKIPEWKLTTETMEDVRFKDLKNYLDGEVLQVTFAGEPTFLGVIRGYNPETREVILEEVKPF